MDGFEVFNIPLSQVPCILKFPLSELLTVPGCCGEPLVLLVTLEVTFERKRYATLLADRSSVLACFNCKIPIYKIEKKNTNNDSI